MTDREEAERIVTSSYMLRHTLIDAVAAALSAARAEQREANFALDTDEIASVRRALIEHIEAIEKQLAEDYYDTVDADARRCRALLSRLSRYEAKTNDRQPGNPQGADVAQPRSAELSGEAPAGRIVCWNEPLCLKPHFVAGYVARAPETEIITAQKGNFSERNYTDEEALDEFMIVHWAWFEDATETPSEQQAKIVKWLRTKADQPWNIDTPVLRELADAIERGEYEGAEK